MGSPLSKFRGASGIFKGIQLLDQFRYKMTSVFLSARMSVDLFV